MSVFQVSIFLAILKITIILNHLSRSDDQNIEMVTFDEFMKHAPESVTSKFKKVRTIII